MKDTKTLGIIGGLGPLATSYFMQTIIQMTRADYDTEHIPMLIYNDPQIPDRTAYILNRSHENPVPRMVNAGWKLETIGAQILALPCATAHYFYKELALEFKVPLLHMLRETALYLKHSGVERAGLMATTGTVMGEVFLQEFSIAGISLVVPENEEQQMIMDVIYRDIKAGKPASMDKLKHVENKLRKKGAQVIILGCTELSTLRRKDKLGYGFLDILEVLATTLIPLCGGNVRKEYKDLIS